MARWRTTRERTERTGLGAVWPQPTTGVFIVATTAGLLVLASLVPPALMLPATSLAAVTTGLVVALFVWWRRAKRHSSDVTGWDVAGALAFIGFSAGILTDPEQVLQLFGYGPAMK
jgi:hypothetical protein